MNSFITHTPFTSTWLIPEKDIEWAREVYGVREEPVLKKKMRSKARAQKKYAQARRAEWVGQWANEWRTAV